MTFTAKFTWKILQLSVGVWSAGPGLPVAVLGSQYQLFPSTDLLSSLCDCCGNTAEPVLQPMLSGESKSNLSFKVLTVLSVFL